MCGFARFRRRGDFGEGTNDKLSLGLFSLETYYAVLLLILESKTRRIKENSADFGGFFTLCPYFDPYSNRGQCKRATTNREIDKEKSRRKSGNTMQKDTREKETAQKETECAKRI